MGRERGAASGALALCDHYHLGLHGAQDAALDYAVGAIFLSVLAAPFGLCSTLVARQRANRL